MRDTSDLITIRARALERRNEDLEEATTYLRRIRELGKKYFDRRYNLRKEPLELGILILSYNTTRAINISTSKKLAFRWFGPFYILEANPEKGTYTLTELNGA